MAGSAQKPAAVPCSPLPVIALCSHVLQCPGNLQGREWRCMRVPKSCLGKHLVCSAHLLDDLLVIRAAFQQLEHPLQQSPAVYVSAPARLTASCSQCREGSTCIPLASRTAALLSGLLLASSARAPAALLIAVRSSDCSKRSTSCSMPPADLQEGPAAAAHVHQQLLARPSSSDQEHYLSHHLQGVSSHSGPPWAFPSQLLSRMSPMPFLMAP